MSNRRFFSSDSFWNQHIPESAPTDPRSALWIRMLECDNLLGLYINLREWTIPVYEVDDHTPLVQIHRAFEREAASTYEHKHMRHFLERTDPGLGGRVAADAAVVRLTEIDDIHRP
jgi:hypothetical protein